MGHIEVGVGVPTIHEHVNRCQRKNVIRANVCLWIACHNRTLIFRGMNCRSDSEAPRPQGGLPEEEVSFILCPLTPPTRRLAGHVSVK